MLKEGMIVGERYEIIGRVGSGGMADVYKARDHKLNRMVAFKVLKAEFSNDTNFVGKFQREAQAAARLSHPNIVNVYDVGEDNGINYIVMELVEGITLKDYITRKGKLSVREATSIAIQVSLGLEAAHNSGIIHRDVKPQNIIISIDGKVKLSDFGIARATSSNTISTNMMGSVHYSSPEQVRGGYSDAKSDIYSLGITMYEMVTGRVPFDGESTVSIAIKHLQEEMEAPTKYAQIPHSLEQIIFKCTQKSVDRRYNTMSEVVDDLKHSLIDPDGDFVRLAPLSSHAQTIMISPEEMEAIREGHTGNVPVVKPESDADYYKRKYEEYEGKEQYPGYDEDDEYEENEDEDEDGVSSKLEKAMTIGGFVIGGIIICILIFFIGKAAGIFNFGGKSTPTPTVTEAPADDEADTVKVPSFLGKTEEEAKAALKKDETPLGIKVTGEESSDKYEKGQIMYQNVPEGSKVAKNSTIEVKVSSGKMAADEVSLPNLVNTDQAEAEKTLHELGVEPKIASERVASDTVEVGKVVSMDPGAGQTVKKGDTVTLTISKGPEKLKVPDVSNEDQETAKKALEDLGLKVTVKEKPSKDVDKGKVVSTDPAAGSSVSSGDTVTMYVSTGADKIKIENYVNMSGDRAQRELENLGFTVNVVSTTEGGDKFAEGEVVYMDPQGGQEVKVGTTITLGVKVKNTDSEEPTKSGKWKCEVPLGKPKDYNGEEVKVVLKQTVNGQEYEEVLIDGEPMEFTKNSKGEYVYNLKCVGYDGVSNGTIFMYVDGVEKTRWPITFTQS